MNCRPGDLAVVVDFGKHHMDLRGKIFTCVEIYAGFVQPHWVTEPVVYDGDERLVFADSCLRPLRDPGDDAVSEDVRPIPAALVRDIVERDKARRSGETWV